MPIAPTCIHHPSGTPVLLKLKVRPKSTVARLKEKIESFVASDPTCPFGTLTRWSRGEDKDGSGVSAIELTDADSNLTMAEVGITSSTILRLEGPLLNVDQVSQRQSEARAKASIKMAAELMAKHPKQPLKAFTEALARDCSAEGAMMIVSQPTCDLEWTCYINGRSGLMSSFIPYGTACRLTPLIAATFYKRLDVMRALILAGAIVDSEEKTHAFTPLQAAVISKCVPAMELLVANGANIKIMVMDMSRCRGMVAGQHGATLLHLAACYNDLPSINYLLSQGLAAVVSSVDRDGNTPLHLAAAHGGTHIIEALIANGAPVEAQNRNGSTPLLCAVSSVRRNPAESALAVLIANGANTKAMDRDGKTVMHIATGYFGQDALKLLLECEVAVNMKGGADLGTPLHTACADFYSICGSPPLSLLLEHGADVNAVDNNNKTPLERMSARQEACQALADNGADLGLLARNEGGIIQGHAIIAHLASEYCF